MIDEFRRLHFHPQRRQVLRQVPGHRRCVHRYRAWRVLLAARLLGLWQDHAFADAGRVRKPQFGRDLYRRATHVRGAAAYAARQHGVPELRDLSAPNVRDNIAYGLRKQKLSRAKRYELVDEMLDLIALPGYGERKANELSGGQRQRIALARALILRPKVLLLDEPLGALDKQLREQMQLELRALQRTVGITFVFVTHDQEEALTLSDRIAVMSEGRVLQLDTPTGLYERPRSRQVASFIGTMNFFDATVAAVEGDKVAVEAPGLGRIHAMKPERAVSTGDKVQVAIRPEKIDLGETKPNGGTQSVEGTLENAAYLGERSHFFVRLDGVEQPVAVSSQNRAHGSGAMGEARSVWLSWDPESVVLLASD